MNRCGLGSPLHLRPGAVLYPELTAKLVVWGITSVSLSPEIIDRTRQIIAEVEERLGVLPVLEP